MKTKIKKFTGGDRERRRRIQKIFTCCFGLNIEMCQD